MSHFLKIKKDPYNKSFFIVEFWEDWGNGRSMKVKQQRLWNLSSLPQTAEEFIDNEES